MSRLGLTLSFLFIILWAHSIWGFLSALNNEKFIIFFLYITHINLYLSPSEVPIIQMVSLLVLSSLCSVVFFVLIFLFHVAFYIVFIFIFYLQVIILFKIYEMFITSFPIFTYNIYYSCLTALANNFTKLLFNINNIIKKPYFSPEIWKYYSNISKIVRFLWNFFVAIIIKIVNMYFWLAKNFY